MTWTAHVHGVQMTKRQREILAFIGAQEMPPSAREMAEHFGCSVGTIADSLVHYPQGRDLIQLLLHDRIVHEVHLFEMVELRTSQPQFVPGSMATMVSQA